MRVVDLIPVKALGLVDKISYVKDFFKAKVSLILSFSLGNP